ncbi:hypothetical protein CANINC_001676 [Pichia inconspicua]|uniref:Uncharacterized protein n=1 Tax=Pichia inconspicua TaxID=52247 RepID=A0A4T0X359_9ASCO|nr:hypothetical protein CANINC_001676 [[Candida] inconspicua]
MKDENKNCSDMNNRGTVTLKDGEKIVIRLSTHNPALNIATRKHYEGNDNVTFLYQEDDTPSLSKYWEKLAERANIPDVDSDTYQPPVTTSFLIPKLKDLNKSSLSLNDREEESFYANIEREWRIKKEREKLRREKETDIDRRITEFQIEIQRRLAHDDRIIMSPERGTYSETMKSETDESLIILSDIENNYAHLSHNNETIESSGENSSNQDLVIESVYHDNEDSCGSSENILEYDSKQMTQNERFTTFTKDYQNSTDLSVEPSASEVVDSEEHSDSDYSVLSSQASIEQTFHSTIQTKIGEDRDLDNTNDSKDAQDIDLEEPEVQISGLHEFDEQSMNDIACRTPCSIYKDYFDEKNGSNQCNNFDGNMISLLNSSDLDKKEKSLTSTNEEDVYHSDEDNSFTRECLYDVANKCLGTKTYELTSTEDDTNRFENIDDLANYHDAIFEDGLKTDETHSMSDGESITEDASETRDQIQCTGSTQSLLSHPDIKTCTATQNFSEFGFNVEKRQENYGSDSNSHETQASELEMSDNEFHDCNTTSNVSLFRPTETLQSKIAFKEMSPLPAATPQSPRINSILDELLDASLSAYDKKSAGVESTTIDVEAANLISKTLNVVGEIDGELLKHLTEDNEVYSQEEGKIKHFLEEGLEHITVKENFIDLHKDIPRATTTEQDTEHSSLDGIICSFRDRDERSNFSSDFATERFKNKRKLSDVGVQGSVDSFKQSNSLFKRAKCSFLNIFSSASNKDMHRRPNNRVQNFKERNLVANTKNLLEIQEDTTKNNGHPEEARFSIDSPKLKSFDKFTKQNFERFGNLVDAISEFTNTSLICFEPDTDNIAQKDQSLVIDESFSIKENAVHKEDIVEKQQFTMTTEDTQRDVTDAELENLKENVLDDETKETSNVSTTINEKVVSGKNDLLCYQAERIGKNINQVEDNEIEGKEAEDEEVENEEVENEAIEGEEVEDEEVEDEEVEDEEVEDEEAEGEEVKNEEVENEEVENEEVENEEVENEEVKNEEAEGEEVKNEEVESEEVEDEEVEDDEVKDQEKNQFLDQRSTGGATKEPRVAYGVEEELANEFEKEVNHCKDAENMSGTFLGHLLRNYAPFKNIASDVGEQNSSKSAPNGTALNDYGDKNICTFKTTATMDSSDSDVSYIEAEILQLADDDIHILPINYHHASEFSNGSQSPTPSIEVKMEITSSDQTVSFEDITEFMKVDESFNRIKLETDISQNDVPIIEVMPPSEPVNVETKLLTVNEKLNTSDSNASGRKLSAPPVAVRTRSRSPSRRSEISKTLLNTENISKIDLSYKANRVISYGSDEDPIELNPNLPRIYPEMVEEADNFIENDFERHGLEEKLKIVSSDAEEDSQQKIVVKKRVSKKKKKVAEINVEDSVDPSVATFEERLQANSSVVKGKSYTGKVFKKKYHRRNAKGVRGKKRGRGTSGKSN